MAVHSTGDLVHGINGAAFDVVKLQFLQHTSLRRSKVRAQQTVCFTAVLDHKVAGNVDPWSARAPMFVPLQLQDEHVVWIRVWFQYRLIRCRDVKMNADWQSSDVEQISLQTGVRVFALQSLKFEDERMSLREIL